MSSLLHHPMVIREQWENFTDQDHHVWRTLFSRQATILKNRAVNEILSGMEELTITKHQIPKFTELNAILANKTGFSIVPVKGYIPEELFFRFLAQRKFPTTCFIRREDQLDYLQEPDVFHDVFGHIPLLVNPIFADFMQQFGKSGLEAMKVGKLQCAASLYWFTVEFGLIQTAAGFRIYGAGITSSFGESIYSLESNLPQRLKFDLPQVINTHYQIDAFQRTYFVIDSFQQLIDALHQVNWGDNE